MPAPIDYLSQIAPPDFGGQLLSGLQAGAAFRAIRDKRAAAESAARLKEQYSADLTAAMSNPTPQAFASLTAKYPQQREAFKQSWDILNEAQQDSEFSAGAQAYNAIQTGNVEVASQLLDDRIEAMKNSGQDTSELESLKTGLERDPKRAAAHIGLTLSSVDPDRWKKMTEVMQPDSKFRTLTGAEKKSLGLEMKRPYQMSPEGKISQIGGAGVSVTVEGQPQVGTIPPGWQLKKVGNTFMMEPIPGGPAEEKANVLAAKKVKQGELESRAGTVVMKDIVRLENKIKEASWLDPVLGITGAMAARIPGSNRVDAEELKQTIVANIGFDRLQQMREASPTGGALGAISERELSTLQAVLGSLSLSQSEGQLLNNLDRLNVIYKKVLKKAGAYPNAGEFGFVEGGAPSGGFKVIRRRGQ